jgi:UDP-N-acetylmuramyl tripeptide synthase
VCYYGISALSSDFAQQTDEATEDERHQVIDTRTCTHCGSDYVYETRFYSHMGHYHCPNCGQKRPTPTVEATQVTADGFDRLRMKVRVNEQEHEIVVPLPGLYNIYNALAAITAAVVVNTDWAPITSGIEQFKPMFGRGERIQAEGKTMRLLLAKNPTGFNEVLRTLFSDEEPRHLLFVLNDNIADGRDISWIWDVDFERLTGKAGTLIVTGTRAYDLALRLKYAGVREQDMQIIPLAPLRAQKALERKRKGAEKNRTAKDGKMLQKQEQKRRIKQAYGLKYALDTALQNTPAGETLFVVPTYTGLLELHHELEQRGFAAHYWEGKDA